MARSVQMPGTNSLMQHKVERVAAAALRLSVTALRGLWSKLRPPLIFLLQVIAALILLFEEWGWQPLSRVLARLAQYRPIAWLEMGIATLPPYGALVVFALPTTLLLPLKFIAVYLLANGYVTAAGALFIGAKVASTAIIARIFMLTKPALMKLSWFARAYNVFIPWKDAIFARIRASFVWRHGRMVKTRVKLEAKQAWTRWKPQIAAFWQVWKPRVLAAFYQSYAMVRDVVRGIRSRFFEPD